jgi:argininosuccinate lyase
MGLAKAFYADVLDLRLVNAPSYRVLEQTAATMEFLAGVIRTLRVDRERMLEAAAKGFSTASELADEIFRYTGLPHRLAHTVVAHTVTRALDAGMVATDVTVELIEEVAQGVIGQSLGLSEEQVRKALDPAAFVESHDVVGGPAPKETLRMIRERRKRLDGERERQAERRTSLQTAANRLDKVTRHMISERSTG